jgi:voltage-gated potassium channel
MFRLLRPRSYSGLLTSFLILIIVYPLEQYLERGLWLIEVALVVMLVFAINAVTGDRHGVRMALFLGLPAVVGELLAVVWDEPPTIVVALTFVFTLCFLVAVIVVLQRHIMTSDRVSGDTLRGAVCVYVLLGIGWAIAYRFVNYLEPDAFSIADHFVDQDRSLALHIYFSFVTLTTLGYGDISPISPIARTLAWLEAFAGQVYIAITIARLVSMYIAGRSNRADA